MVSGGGSNLGAATLVLRADRRQLNRDLDRAEQNVERRLEKFSRRARVAGTFLAGFGAIVTGAFALATKAAIDYEKSLAEVRTIATSLSQEGFQQLSEDVQDLSREMGISTSEAIPALYQAISAGVPAENVIDFLRTASKAAIGGITELDVAVKGISVAVNGYGADVLTAAEASDLMFTTVRLGITTFNELAQGLYDVIPAAVAAGVNFQEVSAAMAVMTAQGTPTRVATTQLRQVLLEASKGGSALETAIRSLVGRSFRQLRADGLTVGEILHQLRLRVEASGKSMFDLGIPVEALQGILAITGTQASRMTDALEEMRKSVGATDAAFDIMNATAARKLARAMEELRFIFRQVGLALLPVLQAILQFVTPIVTAIANWTQENKGLAAAIFITVAALGTFALFAGLALISAGLVAGAIGTLGITMAGVTGVATAMWIAISGPVGLIIAGIVALIAVGVYLYHRFDAVRNIVDAAWRAIKDFAADAVKSLQPLIEALGYIVGLLGSVWDFLKIPPSPEALTMDTRPLAIIEAEMQQNTGELAQEAGKEMQKATSALTTGRTRWRNVRLEEAQEDSATKIVDAVEQQTRDLIPPIEGIDAGAPDGFKWTDLIPSLSWLPFIPIFGWNAYIGRLNWWTWIKSLSWWTWIKSLSWWTWIKSLSWWTWIKSLSWWTWISSLSWWTWIKSLSWWTWIKSLSWWTWIKSLSWWTWIKSLSWWTWIKSLSWWTWIKSLSWWTWISSLSWWTWIKSLSWWTWIKSLSWWTWIKSLSWWTWIKSLSWWTWIKSLSWWTWIKSLSWWTWISSLSWWTWIKSLSWWTWIKSLSWNSFIPNLNWGAFIDKVRNIGSKARDIGSSAVSDVRDFFADISPWQGAGGIAMAPHLAVVGDVPEAIIPLDRLASIMGGGRAMVFNVENLYGVDDLEDFVQEANLAALRRGQENVLT